MPNIANLQHFKNQVAVKFQLYNSLFSSLPFHRIEKTGVWVSLLLLDCEEGYKKGLSPEEIISNFFIKQTNLEKEEEKIDVLFRFVQYIERQVVLFDALEDAAFTKVNDMQGKGTLKQLQMQITDENMLAQQLSQFSLQLVLTAHPTQFYRGAVLGIIHDISHAVENNKEEKIYTYLQQLGRTPFFQQQKPTPYDEALSLIWYLENVFYFSVGKILHQIRKSITNDQLSHPLIKMGFWPGGDRDGNPFVTANITQQVADALRGSIVRCYYTEIRKLKRRLTFKGVDVLVLQLEKDLYQQLFEQTNGFVLSQAQLLQTLEEIRKQLVYNHSSLYVTEVEECIAKVEAFGFHFASLDIRQDSSILTQVIEAIAATNSILPSNYSLLNEDEKIHALTNIHTTFNEQDLAIELHRDTLKTLKTIQEIQLINGEQGCNRYIISQCNTAVNVFELFALFVMSGWQKEKISVDIVPLFETVEDLQHAGTIMQVLYNNPVYKKHLQQRRNKQTIMVGFSDGTKDGGYLMANWSIYKAKETLTTISKQNNIEVVFFDGRGGPPARGGGKTHQFYAGMGKNIATTEIQLTVQGQTVSSNFGTISSAQYNIEQLINAGISNNSSTSNQITFTNNEEILIQTLANNSFEAYKNLKDHPYFTDYLSNASPLKFYANTNIGSRPAKRGSSNKLSLKDLRAIPFVGAWSQLKQNVPGYYGLGTALQQMHQTQQWKALQDLYSHSLFFRTLLNNAEMAMMKCYFPLTAFLQNHPTYGVVWKMVYEEYERTKKYILLLSGKAELMADFPIDQLSIQMRERIVLPLATIQQHAITKIRAMEEMGVQQSSIKSSYEKLVMRCSFGMINAGRNSA
jgi:phosphoenolpyruvate carboxylase